VPTDVQFRVLSRSVIETYLTKDEPYDCAASAKIERLGIALMERVTSNDPSALVGLPLIALVSLLAAEDFHVV
jgi:septum formation protein